jgi:hypothetical protein
MGGTGGYQVDGDSAQFSNLINELMRMNYHQMANQPASSAVKNGANGLGATKGRANSEKQPSTTQQNVPGGMKSGNGPSSTNSGN